MSWVNVKMHDIISYWYHASDLETEFCVAHVIDETEKGLMLSDIINFDNPENIETVWHIQKDEDDHLFEIQRILFSYKQKNLLDIVQEHCPELFI
jgi:hypothetical protein